MGEEVPAGVCPRPYEHDIDKWRPRDEANELFGARQTALRISCRELHQHAYDDEAHPESDSGCSALREEECGWETRVYRQHDPQHGGGIDMS